MSTTRLVFAEDGVDDYGDNGGEVGAAHYFDEDNDKAAGLKDCAVGDMKVSRM